MAAVAGDLFGAALEDLRALGERVFLVEHPLSRIFRAAGEDHLRYLHNRLTQNIRAIPENAGARSFVLTPNGKIQGRFLVLREKESVILLSDEIEDDALAEEVKRAILQFKVADRMELQDCSRDLIHYSLYGDRVHELAAGLGLAPAGDQNFAHDRKSVAGVSLTAIRAATPIANSFEILAPKSAAFALRTAASMGGIKSPDRNVGAALAELIRIASGQPRFGIDLSEKVLAPECDPEEYISFSKGCYPGQEVVEMATARGRPNRKFIQASCEGELPAGEELLLEEKSVGSLTSAIYLRALDRTIGVGFVKTDAASAGGFTSRSGKICSITTPQAVRELLR